MHFEVGETYHRQDEIHRLYGGQRYGGISTPTEHPVVFLFTGESGSKYGYRDEFRPDGTYWYTGEGQEGDMEMKRGNLAIRNHETEGKKLYLLEAVGEGLVRYVGEATYLDHHLEERPDRNGEMRRAIVFELAVETVGRSEEGEIKEEQNDYSAEPNCGGQFWSKPEKELRSLAMQRASPTTPTTERRRHLQRRSKAITVYARRRAAGECEGCGDEAPFETSRGRPFLEVHHIHRLSDGGPDHPEHVAALCPNCHRRVHHGENGDEYNRQLVEEVERKEKH